MDLIILKESLEVIKVPDIAEMVEIYKGIQKKGYILVISRETEFLRHEKTEKTKLKETDEKAIKAILDWCSVISENYFLGIVATLKGAYGPFIRMEEPLNNSPIYYEKKKNSAEAMVMQVSEDTHGTLCGLVTQVWGRCNRLSSGIGSQGFLAKYDEATPNLLIPWDPAKFREWARDGIWQMPLYKKRPPLQAINL